MLLAQVKEGCELSTVIAFGGKEFVAYESRPVPEGAEAEALAHPMLDVREAEVAAPKPEAKEEKPAAVKKPSGKKEG